MRKKLCNHNGAPRAPQSWKAGNVCMDCARKARTARQIRYNRTAKGNATRMRYRTSEKGKAAISRANAKHERRLAAEGSPRYRFKQQKGQARGRGIPFLLTFRQWWRLWKSHWQNRGRKQGQLVMGRKGDKGSYAVGNVEIITNAQNIEFAAHNRTRKVA